MNQIDDATKLDFVKLTRLSHNVFYIARVRRALDFERGALTDFLGGTLSTIHGILGRGGGRIAFADHFAQDFLGITVAEVFVDPAIDTDWYREAEMHYLGANLKHYRQTQTSLSATALALNWGFAPNTLSQWESGRVLPQSTLQLQRLADALDVEMADLFLPPEG